MSSRSCFSEIDEPTSTTKALMIEVVAPRKFETKSEEDEEEDEDDDALEETPSMIKISGAKKRYMEDEEKEEKEDKKERDDSNKKPREEAKGTGVEWFLGGASYMNKGGGEQDNKIDDDSKQVSEGTEASEEEEELSEDDDDDDKSEAAAALGKVEKEISNDVSCETTVSNHSGSSGKEKQSKRSSSMSVSDMPVSEREFKAVESTKNEETFVDLEQLLRITFDKLLDEMHLLCMPVLSLVSSRHIERIREKKNQREGTNEDIMANSWIRLTVMVIPSSLGIIIERLERIGVGTVCGTLSVFQAELCRTSSPYAYMAIRQRNCDDRRKNPLKRSKDKLNSQDGDDDDNDSDEDNDIEKDIDETDEAAERMAAEQSEKVARLEWKNAASRLRVEQIREQVADQANLSFDYIMLISAAGIMAALGLITNNVVIVVASMIVGPLMGPILGFVFALRVFDWKLMRTSIVSGFAGLFGCVFIGALVGIGAAFSSIAEEDWPTDEMKSRGEPIGLVTGIAIAVPSGAVVCVSFLGNMTGSLVGVAISASLVPPAVYAGVCMAYAMLLHLTYLSNNNNTANDFAMIGGISLALAIINIICICFTAWLMCEFKEVVPTTAKGAFWSDFKATRKLTSKERKARRDLTKKTNTRGSETIQPDVSFFDYFSGMVPASK